LKKSERETLEINSCGEIETGKTCKERVRTATDRRKMESKNVW